MVPVLLPLDSHVILHPGKDGGGYDLLGHHLVIYRRAQLANCLVHTDGEGGDSVDPGKDREDGILLNAQAENEHRVPHTDTG